MGIPFDSETITQSNLILFRDYSDECLPKLRSEVIITLDFSSCTVINQEIDLFIDRTDEAYNKCCPIRSNTITYKFIRNP